MAMAWDKNKISAAYDNGYDKGWNAATGALERVERDYPVKSVIGDIEKIEENKLYLKIQPVETLAKKELDDRVVVMDNDTKIYKYMARSEGEIEEERQELERAGKLEEPALMKKKEVSRSELGSASRVIAYSGKDIRNDQQFVATEIVIHK